MNTSNPLMSTNAERKTIPSVTLKIRLLLLAILVAGVLAVIVPSFADMRGARQEFVQGLCQRAAAAHRDLCR